MKKKLLLIAMCSALIVSATACGSDVGQVADDAGEAASKIMDDAGNMISDAAEGLGDMASDVVSGAESAADQVASDYLGQNEENTTSTGTQGYNGPHGNETDNEGNEDLPENAAAALDALRSGNESYRSGTTDMDVSASLRSDLASNGQEPHTIVITCSDSRVPPELIFNSSLGDLFVIRTAGNVVGDYEIGSVEYAADHLNAPLVLVMGHTECGAVAAAVEGHAEGNIASIVEEIAPSVTEAKEAGASEDELASKTEDLNVENSIKNLRKSETLSKLESEGKLTIKGAKYDINTGEVTYF